MTSLPSTDNPSGVLVLNCGSSSVKFELFYPKGDGTLSSHRSGLAEKLGDPDAQITTKSVKPGESDGSGTPEVVKEVQHLPNANHHAVLSEIIANLDREGLTQTIAVVGHRVVHGGEYFDSATVVDDSALTKIESCSRLAPLHNPANIMGIELTQKMIPAVPNVAVFDTAFHQTLPEVAYRYAVPADWYTDLGVRRYGFHGTSHQYVSQLAAEHLQATEPQLLTAHLGNGCSASAVVGDRCVDTTMGLTPLDGLVMGTRSGSIDPGIHAYVAEQLGLDVQAVTALLNRQSGLLGLSGLSNDMRTLVTAAEEGHEASKLAIEVFCFRLAKELAALATSLSTVDALVFTGGIGENAAVIRQRCVDHLSILGLTLSEDRNGDHGSSSNGLISPDEAPPILVLPTAEEQMIARQALSHITVG